MQVIHVRVFTKMVNERTDIEILDIKKNCLQMVLKGLPKWFKHGFDELKKVKAV